MTEPDSVLSNFYGNLFLQEHLVLAGAWIGLHPDDPTVLGDPSTELAGGDYVRQHARFTVPAAKTVATDNTLTYVGLIASRIWYLVFWDQVAGGHMIARKKLAVPIVVPPSGHFLIPKGDLALTV